MTEYSPDYQKLLQLLQTLPPVVVAYSGGVDSTLLLQAVLDAGLNHLAITAVGPTMPEADLHNARDLASRMRANHRLIESDELADENFRQNPVDRCYHCKNNLFTRLWAIALAEGYTAVVDGSTWDDLADYRPGRRAGEQHLVQSPLMQAGFGKATIRRLSRERGLPTWDRPASPCLSSRLPYGEPIDLTSLRQVEQAENVLKENGFPEVRVRKQGATARIEIPPQAFDRFMTAPTRQIVTTRLRALGFLFVTLDLEGFQSGKLNRLVADLSPTKSCVPGEA